MIGLMAVAGLQIQERALRGRDYRVIGLSGASATFRLGRWRPALEAFLWLLLFVMLIAPMAALVSASLVPAYGVVLSLKTASFSAYEEILFRQTVTRTAFGNSIFLAGTTALGLLVIGVLAGYTLTRGGQPLDGSTVGDDRNPPMRCRGSSFPSPSSWSSPHPCPSSA